MVISPIGKAPANTWPPESFKELATRWIKNGGNVAIIGGKIDDNIKDIITSSGAIDLSEIMSIQQSLRLIEISAILVSVDTGTAHMGSLSGTKTIGLYSSRNMPIQWHPFGQNCTTIYVPLKCSPCRKKVCVNNNECMRRISVDMAWNAVMEAVKK